jgi:hydrogenase maturation protein HypF
MLCVGGHLKNTVAVTAGRQVMLSPHLGDLGNAAATEAFERAIDLLTQLYGREPELVVHDAHPDYHSTLYAQRRGRPAVAVQHHLAHVLACLLEHGGGPERVLGVAWDGTGYGDDGTIWGGEFIVVDRTARTATRFAHLRPFPLPGGDAAAREPRRSAFALLHEIGGRAGPPGPPSARTARRSVPTLGFTDAETALLASMLDKGVNAPLTTSAGRLFDGFAAFLGLATHNRYEAQAAMALEFAADGIPLASSSPAREHRDHRSGGQGAATPAAPAASHLPSLPFPLRASPSSGAACEIDWEPALRVLLAAPPSDPAPFAAAFHAGLAEVIVAVARRAGIGTVALTGGCFQNARLVAEATVRLQAAGFTVLLHRELSPNDNSIAAGQALAAAWGITRTTAGG